MRMTYFVVEWTIWDMDEAARRRAGMDVFLDFDPVNPSMREDDRLPALGDDEPTVQPPPWAELDDAGPWS